MKILVITMSYAPIWVVPFLSGLGFSILDWESWLMAVFVSTYGLLCAVAGWFGREAAQRAEAKKYPGRAMGGPWPDQVGFDIPGKNQR